MTRKETAVAGAKTGWTIVRTVTMLGAIVASRKALDAGWKFVTGREPPARPYDPGVTRGELVAWITVSAAATTIARLLADRSAARRWQAWTGVLPPDVDGARAPAARASGSVGAKIRRLAGRRR